MGRLERGRSKGDTDAGLVSKEYAGLPAPSSLSVFADVDALDACAVCLWPVLRGVPAMGDVSDAGELQLLPAWGGMALINACRCQRRRRRGTQP